MALQQCHSFFAEFREIEAEAVYGAAGTVRDLMAAEADDGEMAALGEVVLALRSGPTTLSRTAAGRPVAEGLWVLRCGGLVGGPQAHTRYVACSAFLRWAS